MQQIRLKREPHNQQLAFINATAPEQLYGGAKRGGKSVALCMKIILLSVLFPGNRILLCRKDFTDLQDTTLAEFWQTCPDELLDSSYGNNGHHKGERCIRLKTIQEGVTSDILYRGLGDLKELEKSKSLNIGALAIDEPSEIQFETFKMLRAQMTWMLPDGSRPPYMVLLASNPEPGWVKTRYIDDPVAGSVFIPSLPRQNPYLPANWEAELRATYDKEWVDKYLDGSWLVTEGTVFTDWRDDVHMVDPFDTKALALYAAIDHATTGVVACTVIGVDHNHNRFLLHEYYEKNRLISQHSADIREMFDIYAPPNPPKGELKRRFQYYLIDPSATAKTQQGANQLQAVADDYIKCGIPVIPAWNAVEAGLNRLKEAIHINPRHVHPFTGQLGAPHFYAVRGYTRNTVKEIKELRKKLMPSGRMEFLGTRHGLDTVRYIENSFPRPPKATEEDTSHLPSVAAHAARSHDHWANSFGKKRNANRFGGNPQRPLTTTHVRRLW